RVREMSEDKERNKEISQAISQSCTTFGMQTFDQSLMLLFKQNVITYEEALRQCSNPDDFALRVSGISGTSDSSWDDFEGGKDATQQPGGVQKAAAPRPGAAAQRPAVPATVVGKITPAAGPKPAAPASKSSSATDDDFQIERFGSGGEAARHAGADRSRARPRARASQHPGSRAKIGAGAAARAGLHGRPRGGPGSRTRIDRARRRGAADGAEVVGPGRE